MCLILNSDSEFARNSYVKAQLQNGRQSLEGDKESNKPIGFKADVWNYQGDRDKEDTRDYQVRAYIRGDIQA
jgi:hypothetical protein